MFFSLPCPLLSSLVRTPPLAKVSLPSLSSSLPKNQKKTKASRLKILFFNNIKFWSFSFDSCLYEVKPAQLFIPPHLKNLKLFSVSVNRRFISSCILNNKNFLFFFLLHWFWPLTFVRQSLLVYTDSWSYASLFFPINVPDDLCFLTCFWIATVQCC